MTDPTRDDPMPVFPLMAKDDLAPGTVLAYATTCWARGLRAQADQVQLALSEMEEWRHRHPDLCHLPDHEHVPAASSLDDALLAGALRRRSVDESSRADALVAVIRRVLDRHATLTRERNGRGSLCAADLAELTRAVEGATS